MIYDLVIVGMGISGITAAIYAKRGNLNVLIIDKSMPGGLLNNIEKIDNYPGFESISGPDLAEKLMNQINKLGVDIKYDEVLKVTLENEIKIIKTKNAEFRTKRIIIATGRSQRTLNLPLEDKLLGKGISTCALCDGHFFKNKVVAVVGGGNSALQESLYLANIVKKIYLVHRKDIFNAQKEIIDKVTNTKNIEIINNDHVTALHEKDGILSKITLQNYGDLPVDGLFIYIGFSPKTGFANELKITNDNGYILVDKRQETNVKGIYAAGDIVNKQIYQLVTAASEGATAAINVINSLK